MFETPPIRHAIIDEWVHKIAYILGNVMDGKTNNTGSVTLTASTTTTTVTNARIGVDTQISLTPTTANAATALGTTYQSSNAAGSLVLTHANNAQTDRTFKYTLVG